MSWCLVVSVVGVSHAEETIHTRSTRKTRMTEWSSHRPKSTGEWPCAGQNGLNAYQYDEWNLNKWALFKFAKKRCCSFVFCSFLQWFYLNIVRLRAHWFRLHAHWFRLRAHWFTCILKFRRCMYVAVLRFFISFVCLFCRYLIYIYDKDNNFDGIIILLMVDIRTLQHWPWSL